MVVVLKESSCKFSTKQGELILKIHFSQLVTIQIRSVDSEKVDLLFTHLYFSLHKGLLHLPKTKKSREDFLNIQSTLHWCVQFYYFFFSNSGTL